MSEERYLIWSNEHNAWWGPGRMGYTTEPSEAGRYSFDEANQICEDANRYSLEVQERMVLIVEGLLVKATEALKDMTTEMSDIQDEAYTELCQENARLKELCSRAAEALAGCTWQERDALIAELRKWKPRRR